MLRRLIRPFLLLLLSLSGVVIETPKAGAELFRIALSTRDFGYLPLYVGMRAGMFIVTPSPSDWPWPADCSRAGSRDTGRAERL